MTMQQELRAFWEHLGLLGALPMAGLATLTLGCGATLAGLPRVGFIGWPVVAMGMMFTAALAFGGTVTQPLGRAVGGVLCGIGAAVAMISTFGVGLVWTVAPLAGPMPAALLLPALLLLAATVGAAGWASLRWRAGPLGVMGAAMWPLATALLSAAGFSLTSWIGTAWLGAHDGR